MQNLTACAVLMAIGLTLGPSNGLTCQQVYRTVSLSDGTVGSWGADYRPPKPSELFQRYLRSRLETLGFGVTSVPEAFANRDDPTSRRWVEVTYHVLDLPSDTYDVSLMMSFVENTETDGHQVRTPSLVVALLHEFNDLDDAAKTAAEQVFSMVRDMEEFRRGNR